MSIAPFKRGDLITQARLNEIVDAINRLSNLTASAPLLLSQSAGGLALSMAPSGRIRLVELTGTLSPGGSVAIKYLFWDGSDWDDVPLVEETAVDPIGDKSGVTGDRAFIIEDDDSGQNLLLQMFCG